MPLLDGGREYLASQITGQPAGPFDNANAHLAVGDSNAAFLKTHTDLQGSNKARKPMEAGYPLRNGAAITFRATFDTGDANFEWLEWGVANAVDGGTMLNRKVEGLGTKASTQTWVFSATVTVTG